MCLVILNRGRGGGGACARNRKREAMNTNLVGHVKAHVECMVLFCEMDKHTFRRSLCACCQALAQGGSNLQVRGKRQPGR